MHIKFLFFFSFLFITFGLAAQSISGQIVNQDNEPIPYANVFIRQTSSGASADFEGNYFLTLNPGEYEVVFSSLGYAAKTMTLIVQDGNTTQDVKLSISGVDLNEIVVSSSKKDPAYAIIQQAVENRKKYLKQIKSSRSKIYLKATEAIENNKKKKAKKETTKTTTEPDGPPDPFAEEEKRKQEMASKLNMIEMEAIVNFQAPKQYKEERTAYKVYGSKAGLFVPLFSETNFNFYENMVELKGISDIPVISPINRTAILSYKYKLIESKQEAGLLVHKIKVMPRKVGNSTCAGFIYINEGLWNINRLDLNFQKGALKFFDAFQLKQAYMQLSEDLWIPERIEFVYQTKQGRFKLFKGNTVLTFSDYENDYRFPDKFFGNEVAVTTKEAYKRDTAYWKAVRIEPLTTEQQQLVTYKDSIEAVVNSKAYQDSIQAEYNKIQLIDVFWDGLGFRNNEKKRHVLFAPLPALIDFEIVGGFRIGPWMSYSRRWENGRRLSTWGGINMGFRNEDVQGDFYTFFRYNPHKLADITFWGGRDFSAINPYDAILNQLSTANYFLNDNIGLSHRIELVNGLYLSVQAEFNDRGSLAGFDSSSFIDSWVEDDAPIEFEDYQAFISDITLSYTPRQKFMTEPNQKVILGSKWPTFTLRYQKGWENVFSSDVNFDYVGFGISQDIILGVFGNSKYTVKTGRFLNTKDLRFIDNRNFRESDPYWYSNPLHSFQALDTSLVTTKMYFEAHHIHHFNGALINNIPLVKKLRFNVVAGAGFLWVKENNYRHEEIFAGLERVFKLGPRRRLRLGTYGVLAKSNQTKTQTSIKFSIDIIDTWKRDWDY